MPTPPRWLERLEALEVRFGFLLREVETMARAIQEFTKELDDQFPPEQEWEIRGKQ